MSRRRLLYVLFLTLSLVYSLFPVTIESIEIQGLKRTNIDEVLKILPVQEGDEVYEGMERDIEIALINTNLFVDPRVEINEDSDSRATVILFLEEKWTLIPLPFFIYSSDGIAGGLFFLESNFLGKRQLIVTGYTYTGDKQFLLLTYQDPKVGDSRFSSGLTYSFTDYTDGPGYMTIAPRLGYNIDSRMSLQSSFRASFGTEGSLFAPRNGYRPLVMFPVGIRYNATVPRDYFPSGFRGEISYSPGFTADTGTYAQTAEIEGQYAFLIHPAHQFELFAKAELDLFPNIFNREKGGRRGERTLPRDEVLSGFITSTDLSYQWGFWSNRTFTGALSLFSEAGIYAKDTFTESSDIDKAFNNSMLEFYYGAGGGLRLYLKRIAIPAMGFDMGYNIPREEIHISFSIGVSM